MDSVTSAIQSLPPVAAYLIIAGLVFGEAAVFIGFVLPGETSVVLGGFLASTNQLNIWALCVLVVVAAIVGDSVGYEVGRLFGPRVVRSALLRRHEARLDAARGTLRERGGPAVFLGRFTAFFRAVIPGLAGLSQMRYRRFLMWNALGGFIWGIGYSLVGYFAGASYQKVASRIGTGAAITIAVVVVVAVVVWYVRRRRHERVQEQQYDAERAARDG
ncbi:MAG: rane-associated protein [Nocardioidaceae bacterium]|nr:rane-associated protein [Nocardioidaceae bacterium]